MPLPQIPLPPGTQDPDVANAVPDIPKTTGEKIGGKLGGALAAGAGMDFSQTALGQSLNRHHETRLANARRHYDAAKTVATALAQGSLDPQTGEPTGIDPTTQQPMTPEQRQHYKDQLEGAWGDYTKIVGTSPEAKQTLEKHRGILDFAITKGHEALAKVISAHQQAATAAGQPPPGAAPAPPPAATGLPNAGTLPPPPTPNPQSAPGGAAAAPASAVQPPSASEAATPALPPASPSASKTGAARTISRRDAELTAPALRDDLASYQKAKHAALEGEQGPIAVAQRQRTAESIGLKPGTREYVQFVAVGKFPASSRFQAKQMYDEDTKTLFEGIFDPASGVTVDNNGMEHGNARIARAADMKPPSPPKLKVVNGVPMGVERDGKLVTPDSPDWDEADAREFKAGQAAYATGEADKLKRQEIASNSYARMRGQVQQYSVIDLDTGMPTMANSNTINANPGKYGAAGIVQTLKNRSGIFDELDFTKGEMNKAIGKLPDEPLPQELRAQLALILADPDSRGALRTYVNSNVTGTLTKEEIDYVTGIIAMKESAMALRSIGGVPGAGSDSLRAAVTAMIPGAETPTKAYAQRQMRLVEGEIKALHRSVPSSEKLGMGPRAEGADGASAKPDAKAPPPKPRPTSADEYLKSIGR